MKSIALAFATLALAGCAALDNASYGSWLDRVGQRQAVPLSPEETRELQARAGELRARGDAIRLQLAAEPDRVRRIAHLRELVVVGDQLRPVEQALRDAGAPLGRL